MNTKAKLLFSSILAISTLLLTATSGMATLPGSGNSTDPYEISDCSDLNQTRLNLTADYELVSDVNCGDFGEFEPIGQKSCEEGMMEGIYHWEITGFNGSFYGRNHTISDLAYTAISHLDCGAERGGGLFRYLASSNSNETVRNLALKNITMSNFRGAGLLSESIWSTSSGSYQVSNISVQGNISITTSTDTAYTVGGITGYVANSSNTKLVDSYANVTITNADGSKSVGGVAGRVTGGVINRTYFVGSITPGTGNGAKGGLVGNATGDYGPGICPDSSNFWNNETSVNISTSACGTAESTSQMHNYSVFSNAGWNFSSIWKMSGYPRLQYEDVGLTIIQPKSNHQYTYENGDLATYTPTTGTRDIILKDTSTSNAVAKIPINLSGNINPDASQVNATANISNGYGYSYTHIPTEMKQTGKKTLYIPSNAGSNTVCYVDNETIGSEAKDWTTESNCPGQIKVGMTTNADGNYELTGLTHSAASEIEKETSQAPIVELVNPPDGSNRKIADSLEFKANITDMDSQIDHATLYTNESGAWEAQATITDVENNSVNKIDNEISNSTYIKWNIEACDTYGNCSYAPSNHTVNVTVLDAEVVQTTAISATALAPAIIAIIFAIALLYYLTSRNLI